MVRLAAAALAAVLATSAAAAQLSGTPLTPGQVLLLANNLGPASAETLKHALGNDDPRVRLAAGRVMAVNPQVASVNALVGALAREQDPRTGAELVRDLLLVGGPAAVAVADPQASRLGAEALLTFPEWQAREQPAQLGARLSTLVTVAGLDPDRLATIVALGAKQHPEDQNQLLRQWMVVAPGHDWGIALGVLDGPRAAPGGDQVLLEALRSDRPSVRLDSVWFVLDQLDQNHPPAKEAVDLAAGPPPPGSSPWEVFGRELVARRRQHKKTPDRSDLIRSEGPDHTTLVDLAVRLGDLTMLEQKAASPLSRSPIASALDARVWQQPSARTILPIAPGIVGDALRAASCDPPAGTFGLAAVTYADDGRPAHLQVSTEGLASGCTAALTALARATVVDLRDAASPPLKQLLVLPFRADFVTCTSAADLDERVPFSADANRPLVHKLKDVKPVYPPAAVARRIAGVIVLDAQISATGCVYSVRVLRTIPELDLPALAAVLGWQYSPVVRNGQPMPVSLTVTVNFLL